MKEQKVYNVQVYFELLDDRKEGGYKIATTGKGDGWNVDFAVFYADNSMDLYKMQRHLHGYTKKHYNKVPQKYLTFKYEAR